MTNDERKALREKHRAQYTNLGIEVCWFCSDIEPDGRSVHLYPSSRSITLYPCDVIKVLDYLDLVEPTAKEEANV